MTLYKVKHNFTYANFLERLLVKICLQKEKSYFIVAFQYYVSEQSKIILYLLLTPPSRKINSGKSYK
jgi:hypothetical protein